MPRPLSNPKMSRDHVEELERQLRIEAERIRGLFPSWTEDQVRRYAEKCVNLTQALHEYREASVDMAVASDRLGEAEEDVLDFLGNNDL